ncbi:uncharacterized protein LOC123297261 [Chrysoperla carnea]|uniref:uncharacterized protein LOC123297261 n=1 Tax=Chrysoperla carnea TaxID=189513 RepID=UPI001D0993A9|nr:uncharacterized protein LOC123297261 [Chrysoperla carnea]
MKLKITFLLLCFQVYQITNTLAGTCERQEVCSNTCALVCKNTTESEVLGAAHGYDKLIVQYGSLVSVASLFLNNPNLVKILEIRENEDLDVFVNDKVFGGLKIQELERPLTQEIGLEELTLENTKLELLWKSKLFENFGKLTKLSIHKCNIERVFRELFRNLTNLEYLSLKSNGIMQVENQALSTLHNLKYLDLSDNFIKSFSHENCYKANNLQEFHISRNPLSDFNVRKFLRDKLNLWMANMHTIYCNTFRFMVMDAYQELGYKPTYLHGVECSTPHWYYKCNSIIMKDSNNRNITIAEVQENKDKFEAYYESNINDIFLCYDDCSTQLIDYFRKDDEYAEQLASNVLQYYMGQIQKNFKDFYIVFKNRENILDLKASIDELHSVINITSHQMGGKL